MTDAVQTFHPGQIVSRSGIHPPLPHGCHAEGWVLERAAGHP
jgi:hypothetical protein